MNEKNLKIIRISIKTALFILLIFLGVKSYTYFMTSKPLVKKGAKKTVKAFYVDIKTLNKKTSQIIIKGMGTVVPEKSVDLKTSVSGKIVFVSKNFYPGGIVKKGEIIAEIEKEDYLYQIKKLKAQVKQSEAELSLEIGKQESAKKELSFYEKSGMDEFENKSLALRQPQLKSARAKLESSEAELSKAQLDLSRTIIKAPFDSVIIETYIEEGSYISSLEKIALLYGTSSYRILGYLPQDRIKRLVKAEQNKALVKVYSQTSDLFRTGNLKSLTGRVSKDSRMVEIIAEVKDPLSLDCEKLPLIAGDYISFEIMGDIIKNVFEIPRENVHDNNIWIFNNGVLEIRPVEIIWKDDKNIFVKKGIKEGEKIVTSSINIPVNGMPLKIDNNQDSHR
ncbi:MAG: efflux RND transporter periplasmic adaptor subunit [Desulforegulaceae bacterium]|nr:efflux RND transporter periplasmic adaptor subunit [Desulforegulaceae bacterium]